jgi:hypothetical protein
MDADDICTNLRKKKYLANIFAIYGQGRELFRPPMYCGQTVSCLSEEQVESLLLTGNG